MTETAQANFDPAELAKFSALAHRWWDPTSEFRPLHEINPVRLAHIERLAQGLAGKRVLDVGCGGGILAEAMARAGVLSASYKFKVLSLDARGRQFLVMVDLARDHGGETALLAELEASIAQGAKSRHDILVTAVYWRMNEHVAVGDLNARAKSGDSHPVPLEAAPAPVSRPAAPVEAPAPRSRFEPIQPDEVAAFKQALAAGAANPGAAAAAAVGVAQGASARAFDGSNRHGPQSYTLLTGFEDTELPDSDQRMPALSGTQYGDLR